MIPYHTDKVLLTDYEDVILDRLNSSISTQFEESLLTNEHFDTKVESHICLSVRKLDWMWFEEDLELNKGSVNSSPIECSSYASRFSMVSSSVVETNQNFKAKSYSVRLIINSINISK